MTNIKRDWIFISMGLVLSTAATLGTVLLEAGVGAAAEAGVVALGEGLAAGVGAAATGFAEGGLAGAGAALTALGESGVAAASSALGGVAEATNAVAIALGEGQLGAGFSTFIKSLGRAGMAAEDGLTKSILKGIASRLSLRGAARTAGDVAAARQKYYSLRALARSVQKGNWENVPQPVLQMVLRRLGYPASQIDVLQRLTNTLSATGHMVRVEPRLYAPAMMMYGGQISAPQFFNMFQKVTGKAVPAALQQQFASEFGRLNVRKNTDTVTALGRLVMGDQIRQGHVDVATRIFGQYPMFQAPLLESRLQSQTQPQQTPQTQPQQTPADRGVKRKREEATFMGVPMRDFAFTKFLTNKALI